MLVSESEERQIGAQAYRQVLASEPQSHDAEFNALVEKVGRRIAQAAERPPANMWKAPHYSWEFRPSTRTSPTPSACPAARSRSIPASCRSRAPRRASPTVIGHEVAHALARHGAERMSDQKVARRRHGRRPSRSRRPSSGRSRTYVPAMMAAVGAGATVGFMLPMSRAQELEADHIGLVLMALAGYDPREAIGRVGAHARRQHRAEEAPEWLSTHPADTTRLADIRHWVPEAMKYYRPP